MMEMWLCLVVGIVHFLQYLILYLDWHWWKLCHLGCNVEAWMANWCRNYRTGGTVRLQLSVCLPACFAAQQQPFYGSFSMTDRVIWYQKMIGHTNPHCHHYPASVTLITRLHLLQTNVSSLFIFRLCIFPQLLNCFLHVLCGLPLGLALYNRVQCKLNLYSPLVFRSMGYFFFSYAFHEP